MELKTCDPRGGLRVATSETLSTVRGGSGAPALRPRWSSPQPDNVLQESLLPVVPADVKLELLLPSDSCFGKSDGVAAASWREALWSAFPAPATGTKLTVDLHGHVPLDRA